MLWRLIMVFGVWMVWVRCSISLCVFFGVDCGNGFVLDLVKDLRKLVRCKLSVIILFCNWMLYGISGILGFWYWGLILEWFCVFFCIWSGVVMVCDCFVCVFGVVIVWCILYWNCLGLFRVVVVCWCFWFLGVVLLFLYWFFLYV